MGFSAIVPSHKVKPGTFKVSTVQMRKTAPWVLQINMPHHEFTGAFGSAETFSIFIGTGSSDAGKLKIQADPLGPFKPKLLKNCVIFRLPPTDWTLQDDNVIENPTRRQSPDGMVIELPIWAYDETAQKNLMAARKAARNRS